MNVKYRQWVFIILAFIVSIYIYILISYFGMEVYIKDGPIKDYMNSNLWHLEIIICGVLFGALFIHINYVAEREHFRKRSFGFNILLRTVLYLIALILVGVLVYFIYLWADLITIEQLKIYQGFLSTPFMVSILVYFAIVILLMNFILYINRKFGPGVLIDLLTGRYHHPREEILVFLFMDLKGSTTLAEQLGSAQYSRFLKESIYELSPVIQKYKARVYQYVGDEVVVYWENKVGFDRLNCMSLFFDFSMRLKQKEQYFNSTYGVVPVFKAGMDTGVVTATEIGDIKREIAFHGDVLNTASRLEKKCNEFDQKLIISQRVMDEISTDHTFQLQFLSDLPLRGKKESIKFYAVETGV